MIQILRETTADLLPHTYYVREDKLVAFQPVGGEYKVFKKPMSFSKSRRKFEKLGTVEHV